MGGGLAVNVIERIIDEVDPGLSVRLRALKMRLRHDVCRRLILEMVRAGDVVLDIGANRGVYTYLMSASVNAGGRVHAIDPFPGNGRRLRTVAGRRGNITVHELAASDRSGTARLRVPVHDGHPLDALASLQPGSSGQETSCSVSTATLDDLLDGERRITFVKCDVEGHEQHVFRGAARTLDRHRPVIFTEIEQRHRQDRIESTFEFLADAGYHGWFVTAGGLRPLAEFDITRHQLTFLDGQFIPYRTPAGYVTDFLFCPPGAAPAWAPHSPARTHRPRSAGNHLPAGHAAGSVRPPG